MPPVESSVMPPASPLKTPSKRKWWIWGSVGAVLVLIFIALATGNKSEKKTATISSSGAVSSVTGADLLEEKPEPTAVSYQETPVIQACNLFTLSDVKTAKLSILPNAAADSLVFERNYFNGQGSAPVNDSQDSLNSCRYGLENNESIELNVLQAVYTDGKSMQSELERFSPSTAVGGLRAYHKTPGATGAVLKIMTDEYLLQTGNDFVRAVLTHKADSTFGQHLADIVATIAVHTKQQAAQTTGPATLAYNSSAFPKSYANACSISRAEDFTTVFSADPMPHVTEGFATKVGSVYFNDDLQNVLYPNIRHECLRQLSVPVPLGDVTIPKNKELKIQTTTYLTAEASKKEMAFRKKIFQTRPPSSRVGDEAYVIITERPGFGKPGTVVFRQGRAVVYISFVDPLSPKTEASNLDQAATLEKAATQIAPRLKGF